jgi:hypothetical protein
MKTVACIISLVISCSVVSVAAASEGGVDHRTSICHRTMSESNPWVLIEPDNASLPAHWDHGDVESRDGSCPATADGWPPPTEGGDL